ncbi:MAG TPA: hypothetical protein DEA22_01150 [Blastocatellia bacterium]|nr:hypothetical protein [Blastocatellia bacterium]
MSIFFFAGLREDFRPEQASTHFTGRWMKSSEAAAVMLALKNSKCHHFKLKLRRKRDFFRKRG